MAKRYYWLKMKKDFATDKRIKKLKKIPGGYNFAFIYLEMILNAVDSDGIILYEGIEDTLAKEIALELDEDSDAVQITVSYLMSVGLMEDLGGGKFLLPYVTENLGSEGASAKRMRDLRERQKALQCNEKPKIESQKASHCDTNVTNVLHVGDVETETDIETDIDIETDRQEYKKMSGCLSKRKQYIPTLEEVTAYVESQNLNIDPVKFYEKNQERGWITKQGQPIKRWKSILWSWSEHEKKPDSTEKNGMLQNTYDFDKLEQDLVRN